MKKIAGLCVAIFTANSMFVNCQVIQKYDTIANFEKAIYLKGNLLRIIQENVNYPKAGLLKNIQGDVVLSFVINKNGKLDSLVILSSPDISLSTSAIVAFNPVDEEWSPSKIDTRPIDKKYLIVFRYRMYTNTQPPDYKSRAEKYVKKQKNEKALKLYNLAIKDNPYDYKLLESRSKIKEKLGDIKGSIEDNKTALKLNNDIMSIIDVEVIGITRTEISIGMY